MDTEREEPSTDETDGSEQPVAIDDYYEEIVILDLRPKELRDSW